MLFPLLQSIVKISGLEPEISSPKFKICQGTKNRIFSAGVNTFSHHSHVEVGFQESQKDSRVQEREERWLQGMGRVGKVGRKTGDCQGSRKRFWPLERKGLNTP